MSESNEAKAFEWVSIANEWKTWAEEAKSKIE